MLDIGWQELLVIGVLALLVVGPKELPKLLRTVGQWAGKARSMAREFQRSMDDAAREADLDEFRRIKDLKGEIERGARMDFSEQAKRAQSYMNAPKGGSETGAGAGQNTGAAAPEASRPNGTAPPAPAETTAPEPRPEAAAPSPDGPKA